MQLATMVNSCVDTWLQGNRNYREGVALLRQLQPGSLTVLILEAGDDEYNQNLLAEELLRLSDRHKSWLIPVGDTAARGISTDHYLYDSLNATRMMVEAIGLPEVIVPAHHRSGWHEIPAKLPSEFISLKREQTQRELEREYLQIPVPELPARDAAADLDKRMRLKGDAGQLWQEMAHVKGGMSILRSGKALKRLARQLITLNEKRQGLWDQIDFFDENGFWHDEQRVARDKPADLEKQIKNQMGYRSKAKRELEKPLTRSQRAYLEGRIELFNKEIKRLVSLREVPA